MVYRFARWVLRLALRLYYREIEVHGLEHVPETGAVLLMANHHNGMVDPFILIAALERKVRFLAKSTLFKVPGLAFFMRHMGVIPVYRQQDTGYAKEKNEQVYAAVRDALVSGSAVGIFPEGRSRPASELGEFKHGAAKMALEAEGAAGWALGLRMMLVGIHFEHTRLFRGRVLVTIAPPLDADDRREHAESDPRGAVEALTRDLQERMSRMVLDADSRELEELADIVERIAREPTAGGLKARFDVKKMAMESYERLKTTHPDEVAEVVRRLRGYRRMLKLLGVRDGHVEAEYQPGRVARSALAHASALVAGSPFLAAGVLLHALPYWLTRLFVALAGREEDMRASVGVLASIVVYPAWYALLAWQAWLRVDWRIWAPALLAGPVLGLLAIRWLERWRRAVRDGAALLLALRLPGALGRLKAMRREIAAGLARLQELDAAATSGPSSPASSSPPASSS